MNEVTRALGPDKVRRMFFGPVPRDALHPR
jgi:hypothetical protein